MSTWFDRRYTDAHWDHVRDERKHEPRHTDPLPLRFSPPISSALETAVLVKGVKDPREAAKLVEQYAQTAVAAARLERTIVDASSRRMLTVSYLTAYLDTLLRTGDIPADLRPGIRKTVDQTRSAFDLPALGPTEASNAPA